MTDREKLDKLVAEIERLIVDYNIKMEKYRGVNEQAHQYYGGKRDALSEILKSIVSMQEESVSENLEEAANNFLTEFYGVGEPHNPTDIGFFKAGAEWQKEQMMAKAVDGVVHHFEKCGVASVHYTDPTGVPMGYFTSPEGLSAGDKVKIIVIKEY